MATGEAHALIGGDLVVSAGASTLGLTKDGQTGAVVNAHEIITGDFTRNTEFKLPTEQLKLALQARMRDRVDLFDASELARKVLGDAIFSNMLVFGAAWQRGLIPLSLEAMQEAIRLNGAAVEKNLYAFDVGRWAVLHGDEVAILLDATLCNCPSPWRIKIAFRAQAFGGVSKQTFGQRYRKLVDAIEDPTLKEAVAKGYHKLLSYKDEYEVARLHLSTAEKAAETFEGDLKLTYHLAPPMLSKTGADGRPMKKEFGAGMLRGFKILAKMKRLRGTPFDPFGRTAERRMERALITQFEADHESCASQSPISRRWMLCSPWRNCLCPFAGLAW